MVINYFFTFSYFLLFLLQFSLRLSVIFVSLPLISSYFFSFFAPFSLITLKDCSNTPIFYIYLQIRFFHLFIYNEKNIAKKKKFKTQLRLFKKCLWNKKNWITNQLLTTTKKTKKCHKKDSWEASKSFKRRKRKKASIWAQTTNMKNKRWLSIDVFTMFLVLLRSSICSGYKVSSGCKHFPNNTIF